MAVERESFVLSDEQVTELKQDITNLDEKISPHATNLTIEEIRRTYKLGPQALPFVAEVIKCSIEYPSFRTPFFDLDKLEKDFTLYQQTGDLSRDLSPVLEKFTDTSIKSGADAFKAARAFYEAVRAAAKANKVGADAVVARLQKVFYKRAPVRKPKEEPTPPTTPTSET